MSNLGQHSSLGSEKTTEDSKDPKVVSPFADSEIHVPSERRRRKRRGSMIMGLGAILVAALVVGGLAAHRYLGDPYRTLPSFPVTDYLTDHRPVVGARFGGELRVEADLGWREGAGRLMLFTFETDPRPVAVLLPAGVADGLYFTKGQRLQAELAVKQGGLIHAESLRTR